MEQPIVECTEKGFTHSATLDETTERVEELKQQMQHWYQEAKKWYQKVTELSNLLQETSDFLHTKLDDSNEKIVELTIQNNSLAIANDILKSEKEVVLSDEREKKNILMLQLTSVTHEFSILESNYVKLMKDCEIISSTILQTKEKNAQLEKEANDLKLQVQQLTEELDAVNNKSIKDLNDLEQTKQQLNESQSQLLSTKRQLEDMKQENEKLRQQNQLQEHIINDFKHGRKAAFYEEKPNVIKHAKNVKHDVETRRKKSEEQSTNNGTQSSNLPKMSKKRLQRTRSLPVPAAVVDSGTSRIHQVREDDVWQFMQP